MKHNLLALAVLSLVVLTMHTACKKSTSRTTSPGSCGTLRGFTAPASYVIDFDHGTYPCSYGIINTSTASITTVGSIPQSLYWDFGSAFNNTDSCYYAWGSFFVQAPPDSILMLNKITSSGIATTFSPVDTCGYLGLVYNSVTRNIYCMKDDTLSNITLGTTSFTASAVASPVHSSGYNGWAGLTVDNATGNMYYDSYDSVNCYIELYHPGDSVCTVVASYPILAGWPYCLRFNNSDHMLYGIKTAPGSLPFFRVGVAASNLVRINPSGGAVTTLGSIGYLNLYYLSATIDQCSNRYIISSVSSSPSYVPVLLQLNMSGDTVQIDHPGTFYQGLVAD